MGQMDFIKTELQQVGYNKTELQQGNPKGQMDFIKTELQQGHSYGPDGLYLNRTVTLL